MWWTVGGMRLSVTSVSGHWLSSLHYCTNIKREMQVVVPGIYFITQSAKQRGTRHIIWLTVMACDIYLVCDALYEKINIKTTRKMLVGQLEGRGSLLLRRIFSEFLITEHNCC